MVVQHSPKKILQPYLQTMRSSRTSSSTTTGTVWSPDSRASPATTEPKPTERRLGWRSIVCLHSRWRETRSKVGRPAVLCSRRGGQGGWECRATSCTGQVVGRCGTVVIWWLNDSSRGWLICKLNISKKIIIFNYNN